MIKFWIYFGNSMLKISSEHHGTGAVILDSGRKKIDFICRFLRNVTFKKNQFPINIIRHIAHNCLEEFVKHTLELIFHNQYEDEGCRLITSCANTFCSFSTLFMGINKTKEMMYLININPTFIFNIQLPSGNLFSFKTFDLFAGHITHAISQDPEYKSLSSSNQVERIYNFALPHLKEFSGYVQQFVISNFPQRHSSDKEIGEAIVTHLKESKFMFNRTAIHSLRKAMRENSKDVTPDKSFLYCINVKIPVLKNQKLKSLVDHAILLEQFCSPDNGATLVRPFQSWIDTATLLDDISKRQFNEMGKGSWDERETVTFLHNFEDYYCSETGYLESEKAEACFGFNTAKYKKQPLVRSHKNYFTGVNVRYIIKEFDPAHCLKYLQEIVNALPCPLPE